MIWTTDGVDSRWPVKPLASLTTKVGSGATPRGGRRSYPDQGIPFIRSQNVHFDGFSPEGLAFLTTEQSRQLNNAIVQADDVLLNITGASIGRVCIAPAEMAGARVNQHVCIIRPSGISSSFLAGYLASPQIQSSIVFGNYGVTREALTKSQILELPVPVPPAAEQDRLEKLLVDISTHRLRAANYLRTAGRAIKRLRQSVLAAASSGRRMADWRIEPGLSTADEPSELPPGWKVLELRDLAASIRGGSGGVPENDPTDFPILRSSSVRPFEVDITDVRYLKTEQSQREANFLQEGDLLITRLSGSIEYVGNCAIVGELQGRRIQYPDRLFCCRLHDSSYARFVELAFASPELRRQIEAASKSAAGHQRISISDLKSFRMALPPIDEQREIVRRASKLLATADALLTRINDGSRAVDRSSQATLAKAFRGELLPPQDAAASE